MNPWIELGARALVIGFGATLLLDAWLLLLKALKVPTLNFAFLGRWVGHGFHGRWTHQAIAKAAPIRGELCLGWLAHYAIGLAFAALLLGICGLDWARDPSLLPALAFGIATVAAPLFILQPAMGAGVASSRTATPVRNVFKSVVNHAVFGVGLYAATLLSAALFYWSGQLKFEFSSGIFDTRVLEELFDPLGFLFELDHVFGGSGFELGLGTYRHLGSDGMFDVCIEALLRIQFGAVTGQIEEFDLVLPLSDPRLDRLAVMYAQVIEDQKDLLPGILDQRLKELDQPVGIERIVDDHPARLPFVGDRGNHRQLLPGTAYREGDRGLSCGSVAATTDVGVDQGRFVAPVNLAAFGLGALLDLRVCLIKPGLYRFRSLLIGLLDRLLRGEAPARQVVTHSANRELDAVFPFNQLHDRRSVPQRKFHLELFGPLVADRAANTRFLFFRERPPIPGGPSSRCGLQCGVTAFFIQVDGQSHCRITQTRHAYNRHHSVSFPVQSRHLLAPLVQLLQLLVSSVFFVHAHSTSKNQNSSAIIVPNQ